MRIPVKVLGLAARGDLRSIEALLAEDPRLLDAASGGHNRTLLWEAARAGRAEVVRYLVEAGADVNIPGRYRHETLVLVRPYCVAVQRRRMEVADYLLRHGTEIDLYLAAFLGRTVRLRDLLASRPEAVHERQSEEEIWKVTPLHHAVAGDQIEAARLLIDAGAEVEAHARLLFDFACRRGSMRLARLLRDAGADPAQADGFPVVRSGDPDIIDFFFSRGCPVVGLLPYVSRGDKGEHPEWVAALLEYGADVNETDARGRTALHNAARGGFAGVAEVLLAAGARVDVRMDGGATPLSLAIRRGRDAVADLLRAHGATS